MPRCPSGPQVFVCLSLSLPTHRSFLTSSLLFLSRHNSDVIFCCCSGICTDNFQNETDSATRLSRGFQLKAALVRQLLVIMNVLKKQNTVNEIVMTCQGWDVIQNNLEWHFPFFTLSRVVNEMSGNRIVHLPNKSTLMCIFNLWTLSGHEALH